MAAQSRMLSILCLIFISSIALSIVPVSANSSNESSNGTRRFRLLAVETQYDSGRMRSAQFLINELLGYQNWNNATTEYVSYIHLLSLYNHEEVDDTVKPFLRGTSNEANVKNEALNFLGESSAGEIVLFYYCGHGLGASLRLPDGKVEMTELNDWLSSGGLPQAFVIVILDTCDSGAWIADGEGSMFGVGRVVLTSCKSGQTSWGWWAWWSWFTYIGMIEGFQFAEDSNGDGWISAAEDFAYAKPATESYSSGIGLPQNPTSYFGVLDGDIPIVQKDTAKPFPLWDIAVTYMETSTEIVLSGSPVTVAVTVVNQGVKTWNQQVGIYYDSTLAMDETVAVDPGETVTLLLLWNTTGTYEGSYLLSVKASVGPGELDTADNTFVDGILRVYNAKIDVKPDNLKLRSEGASITCYIELPPVFDVDVFDIDVSSVRLGTEVPAGKPSVIEDFDNDGILELMVRFDREAAVSYILSTDIDGYITGFSRWVTVRVIGRLLSGTFFEGFDIIRVTFHPLWQEIK